MRADVQPPVRSSYVGQAQGRPTTLAGTRRVGYLLSLLLIFASLTLAVPLAVAAGYGEPETVGDFAATLLMGVIIGLAGYFLLRTDLAGLTRREGFAAVAAGWLWSAPSAPCRSSCQARWTR